MQERFSGAIPHFSAVSENVRRLVAAANVLNVPCIATEQVPAKLGRTVASVMSELEKQTISIVPKTCFTMIVPDVERRLAALGRRVVILCGIESHACVLATAIDLVQR